jgi:hypothetical protein
MKENRLYRLLCLHVLAHDSVQVAWEKENLIVWHERFGPLGEQNLKFLVQKNLITSMDAKTN